MELPKQHDDQYKMLRAEILSLVDESRKLEFQTVVAVGILYSWLAVHTQEAPWQAWFIGLPLILASGIRCYAFNQRIKFIAEYLVKIEEEYFCETPSLPGYERYVAAGGRPWFIYSSSVLWIILVIGGLTVPILMGFLWKPPHNPPAPVIKVIGTPENSGDGTR